MVGCLEDGGSRAVVALQPDDVSAGKILVELLDVFDAGTAPAVNRLIIVANHHQVIVAAGQHAQPGVLHSVSVLELIDQDMAEAALIVVQQAGIVQPQLVGAQQDFSKVHHAAALTGLFIGGIDREHGAGELVTVVLYVGGAQTFVFLCVDVPLHLAWGPFVLVNAQRLAQTLDQPKLVITVQDLEVLRQIGFTPVLAQQPVRQAMESADPHTADRALQQLFDTAAHFAGGLVGKCHGQNAKGRYALHLHQPGDAMDQHAGLAAAGASQYQHTTRGRGDSPALLVVQGI